MVIAYIDRKKQTYKERIEKRQSIQKKKKKEELKNLKDSNNVVEVKMSWYFSQRAPKGLQTSKDKMLKCRKKIFDLYLYIFST